MYEVAQQFTYCSSTKMYEVARQFTYCPSLFVFDLAGITWLIMRDLLNRNSLMSHYPHCTNADEVTCN